MPLPLIPVNALAIPTGTAHFTLTAGILSTDSAMTLTDGSVAAATLPLYGNVRLLVYKTGDTNPEYVDMTSRSGAVLQIDRQTEESTLRPKCDHAIGASVWIVQTADMVVQHVTVGAPVLLEEHIASASAQLDFTKITSDYDEYIIELINVLPATDNVTLELQMSTNGGVTFDTTSGNYWWSAWYVGTATDTGAQVSKTTGYIQIAANILNTVAEGGLSGALRLYEPGNTSSYKRVTVDESHSAGTNSYRIDSHGQYRSLNVVNALRFLFSSGNIASGTIRLYGVSKVVDANALTTEAYAVIQDQKTTGTHGGTLTAGGWRTRDLNTIVTDTRGIILALVSNQFTLGPGEYEVWAQAPGFVVNAHQIRLQNITDAVTQIHGMNAHAQNTNVHTPAMLFGKFIITANKVFEIQHQSDATEATVGFGAASSGWTAHETYASVQIRRVGAKITSGDWVKLGSLQPTGTTVDFTNIPAGFSSLELRFQCRTNAAVSNSNMLAQFNGDTGNNYDWTRNLEDYAGLIAPDDGFGTSSIQVAAVAGTSAVANYATDGKITLPNYSKTTFYKNVVAESTLIQSVARNDIYGHRSRGYWRNAAAINRIVISLASGSFVSGSVFDLYGIV